MSLRAATAALTLLALCLGARVCVAAAVPGPLEVRAQARAEGNDRAAAVALGRVLLAHPLPVQILHVRVDRVDRTRVAGIILSGVKFHEPVGERAFVREVAQIVGAAFAASDVAEVDVWAVVPLDAGKGAIVSGDLAKPTSRTVFTVTVERSRQRDVERLATTPAEAFWDPVWRGMLQQAQAPRGAR